MSLTNIKSKIQSERGFTIVELLIVVVVIAILAAITIVSYNGITRSANASSAKSLAATVAKKLEAYQAETGRYPINPVELRGDSSKSYYLDTNTTLETGTSPNFTFGQTGLTASNGTNTVIVRKCGSGTNATTGPTNQAAVTATNITGLQVLIWAYDGTPAAAGTLQASQGQTSGLASNGNLITCPTS